MGNGCVGSRRVRQVYAVRVIGAVLDLDEIKEFEQELDKIIQTVNSFVDKAD
jgi:hypothetical protein